GGVEVLARDRRAAAAADDTGWRRGVAGLVRRELDAVELQRRIRWQGLIRRKRLVAHARGVYLRRHCRGRIYCPTAVSPRGRRRRLSAPSARAPARSRARRAA